MGSNESENISFAEAMDVVAISIVAPCALQSVLQPAVLNPLGNLVVVLPETQSKVTHRIPVSHTTGSANAFQLIDDGTLRTVQSLWRYLPTKYAQLVSREDSSRWLSRACEQCAE